MTTTLIKYDGALAAFVSRQRVHFCPPLDERPDSDPLRGFVHLMASYARDVATGELEGPYSDAGAELYARTALIDDEAFAAAAGEPDDRLAERFGVPVEQIARKRADLERQP